MARSSEPPTEEDDDGASERVGMMVAGRYKLLRVLGAGGMGAVYEAEHEQLGKRVALKTLHREYAKDKGIIERFHREARAATAIGNEHIVDVTDLGVLPDGAPFLVMEMLKGQALADLMRSEGPLPIGRVVRIARQICDALAAVHEKGIVHRDLKPDNVFLTPRAGNPDFVKVLDFGISKIQQHGDDRGLTQTGMALGTPSYMSPEQAQGSKSVDGRTDVWALGVILYEMLAGTRPFDADSYPMLLVSIVTADPLPLSTYRKDVPRVLDELVLRCLEKPVEARVPSMSALSEALAKFEDVEAPPDVITREVRAASEHLHAAVDRDERTRAPRRHSEESTKPVGGNASSPATRELVSMSPPQPADASVRSEDEAPAVAAPADADPGTSTGKQASIAAPARGRGPMIAALVAATATIVIGIAVAAQGGSGEQTEPAEAPPVALREQTPPAASPPAEPAPAPSTEAAAPAEVRIRIRAIPADARILIGGVEFPNPMDAPRPRSLDPVVVRIESEGYEPIERPLIFDEDRSFDFELSRSAPRARGGRGSSAAGGSGGGTSAASTAGASTAGASTGGGASTTPAATGPAGTQRGGFRDDF